MTFQPPPPPQPPAGPPPGSPPPGAWGPPPGGPPPSPAFDPKTVDRLDWGIMAAGLLAFIFSFVSYYKYTVSAGGFSASGSVNAWHGFFGWFAMLLAVAGSVLIGMSLLAPQIKLPIPTRLAALGCYALASLCVILALFVVPGDTSGLTDVGVDKGHGVGYWISLVVILAGLVLSALRFQQTGGQLPGALGNLPGIGGHQGGPGTAPPQGPPPQAPPQNYGPPPTQ
jgi:hypothetical protein